MASFPRMFGKKTEKFPDTLQGFGYEFKDGKLRNIKTGHSFEFVVREKDHAYNQRHYEALGEVITEEVYNLLEEKCGLKRAPVPDNAQGDEPETFIFKSADLMTNEDKLMVLIHGSGVVRAGQWARRLIINDCLESGTQIPYIKRALSEGYAVLVMNTNDNYRTYKNGERRIRGSESPEAHATYVWNHYVRNTKAKHIAIVAHSYGGCVTTDLFRRFQRDFQSRVFAVAMTDSVHYISYPKEFRNLIKISRNWVRSKFPLDTELETVGYDVEQVSSGVTAHEETSWASMESVFEFFRSRYERFNHPLSMDGDGEEEGAVEGASSWSGGSGGGGRGGGGESGGGRGGSGGGGGGGRGGGSGGRRTVGKPAHELSSGDSTDDDDGDVTAAVTNEQRGRRGGGGKGGGRGRTRKPEKDARKKEGRGEMKDEKEDEKTETMEVEMEEDDDDGGAAERRENAHEALMKEEEEEEKKKEKEKEEEREKRKEMMMETEKEKEREKRNEMETERMKEKEKENDEKEMEMEMEMEKEKEIEKEEKEKKDEESKEEVNPLQERKQKKKRRV